MISKFLTLVSWMRVFALVLALVLGACVSTDANQADSNEEDSDSEDDSNGGSGTNGFTVTGRLSSTTVSSLIHSKAQVTGSVTHIMAVNPATGNVTCTSSEVASDGTFEVELTEDEPWILFFIDENLVGLQMFLARFVSSTLDTLIPVDLGSTDLGSIDIDADDATATSEISFEDLLSDLGLDGILGSAIGSLDDIARRYANPDVDENGEVDCSETNASFMLDFHVRFDFSQNGSGVQLEDLIDQYYDESTLTFAYQNTGVYVAYPSSFSSEDLGTVTLVDSSVTTSEGGALAAGQPTSNITTNNFGNFNGFGINTTQDSELPSGEIIFQFGNKTLTFAQVETPALADLQNPVGRIFPFIKLNRTDSSCNASCTLSGIGYKWMKKTESGWESASLDELGLLVAGEGAYVGFRVDDDETRTVGFTLPKTSVEGTVSWESSEANLGGVTASEFLSLMTTQICHVGLSYDDPMGMRYFQDIEDQPSCP